MAKALFITPQDLVKKTSIDGNVDPDKFLQVIEVTQDIKIQPILGYNLYQKLSNDVLTGSLSGDYLTLVTEFIKPVLINFTAADFIPFLSYTLGNGGVFKHSAENSQIASDAETLRLADKYNRIGEDYKERLIDFLCANSSLFPEYMQSTTGRVTRTQNNNPTNWIV
jgi:hypothetical protein